LPPIGIVVNSRGAGRPTDWADANSGKIAEAVMPQRAAQADRAAKRVALGRGQARMGFS